MTVWLVAQPTQGLLLERSLARLLGTVCGAAAGAIILGWSGSSLYPAIIATGIWLALCTVLGSVFRHFRNYGLVLAGYTAAIVVLFAFDGGPVEPELARDRVLCTIIGIIASTLFSFHALPGDKDRLSHRANNVLALGLRFVEQALLGRSLSKTAGGLVAEIGSLDRAIDEYAAGSWHRRREALRTRYASGLLLELVALGITAKPALKQVTADNVPDGHDDDPFRRLSSLASESAIRRVLAELADVTRAKSIPILLDFNGAIALRAAGRAVLALVVSATIWQATDWTAGALMTMTAVLFSTLFSSHYQGRHMMSHVLAGTVAGALAGIAARTLLLPHADGLMPALLLIAPFLLLGAWLMRRPPTAKMAMDFTMTFLLTSQPSLPAAAFAIVLNETAAITAGVLVALGILSLALPATPQVLGILLARRIARMTVNIAQNPDQTRAWKTFRRLRIVNVQMLDVAPANSALFCRTQDCVATVSRLLAPHSDRRWKSPARSHERAEMKAAATQAAAALISAAEIKTTGEKE